MGVESDPENPESFVLYGRQLAYLWRYHDAIEIYTKGIQAYPDHAMLYRHRGHRFISIRKFEDVVADLTKASQLNEENFDIWYHLGLAHFLRGEFDKARQAYGKCQRVAEDDDARIAISNWLYITLRRLGEKEKAKKVFEGITEGMNVVENQSYYDLLLFYKGLKEESEIVEMARTSFEAIVQTPYWPAFGYIAAEVELYRMSLKE